MKCSPIFSFSTPHYENVQKIVPEKGLAALLNTGGSAECSTSPEERSEPLPPPPLRRVPYSALPAAAGGKAISEDASAPTVSQRIARYFSGLAAGEELCDLVRDLRSSMWISYKECVQRQSDSTLSTSPTPREAIIDAGDSNNSTRGRSPIADGNRCDQSAVADTILEVPTPTSPSPIPPDALGAATRQQYWKATKMALLFAAENSAAAEEATLLYCSPITRSLLYSYYYPEVRHSSDGRYRSSSSTLKESALPLAALQRGKVRWILSEAAVVALAKQELRAFDGSSNGFSRWKRALSLLRQVDPTPLTSAVELDIYRRMGGDHWAEALACLWCIGPSRWTEMDVAATVRCLYNAGRRRRMGTVPSSPEAGNSQLHEVNLPEPFLPLLRKEVLRIHQAVETTAAFQWSTPSALNDTLGLIGLDANAWQVACELLDKMLKSSKDVREEGQNVMSSPAADAKGAGPRTISVTYAREDAESSVSSAFHSAGKFVSTQTDTNFPEATLSPPAPSISKPLMASTATCYQLVRANAVTAHQTCRAFRSQWVIGLGVLQQLQDAFGSSSLNMFADMRATESALQLCISGRQWQTALQLVTAHHRAMDKSSSFATCSGVSSSTPSVSASAVQAVYPEFRRHYRSEVLLPLVRLLGSVPASRETAYELIRRHAGGCSYSASTTATGAVGGVVPDTRARLNSSKHYNTDTLSRAYNSLVQGTDTLDAADQVLHQLRQSLQLLEIPRKPAAKSSAEGSAPPADAEYQLRGLETESVAHIAYLAAIEGDWRRALHHTNALLHQPHYSATFLPTARLHDAVQYALEQATPPGPSWKLSFQLYMDMMERNVPSSEVSFQSTVKRCFAGGVPEQAQSLFYYTLKKGIR